MIRVHHLNNSRSQRVLWLLEELELPYEIVAYARNQKTMLAPDTLKAVHPLGKSPVIQDGALTLAETGLIVEYLVDRYGQGRLSPEHGSDAYWRYAYWLHYAEGSLMTPLILKLVLNRLGLLGRPARGFVDAQLKLHFDYLEGELAASPWFAGPEFSAADIMMSFPLEAGSSRAGVDAASKPNLWGFLERIHARPAYQRALERGGKYAYAKPSSPVNAGEVAA
jgi:glutathione S-transferase